MRTCRWWFPPCLTLLLSVAGAAGADTNSFRWATNYYTVTGSTLEELHASLREAPPWRGKSVFVGMTDWRIDWRYRVGGTPGVDGCSCTSFTTQVSIVTTLPRWQPTPEAAPEVVADWNRFIRALGEHEHGHARLALAALADVRHRVKNMGTDPDCRALGRRIEEVVNRAIAEHRARDRDYDVRTRHGANQGAALSPPGRGTGR